MGPALTALLSQVKVEVDDQLAQALQQFSGEGGQLAAAMRYSLTNGGKRVRPLLVYASAAAVSNKRPLALTHVAAAVEAIHAYSLVHDDLPAMDDDDLRRGKPTTHIAFDEATAILAGDALQTLAFELLSHAPISDPTTQLRLLQQLSRAAGAGGMVLGQAVDLAAVAQQLTLVELEQMHRLKTGALIVAAVRMGAILAGEHQPERLASLERYAQTIGLAFQVQDDILDVIGDTATLGKQQGADSSHNKPTYVSLLGLASAQAMAQQLQQQALAALTDFGTGADALRQLANYIVERKT